MQSTTAKEIERILKGCEVKAEPESKSAAAEPAIKKVAAARKTIKQKIHWPHHRAHVTLQSIGGAVYAYALEDTAGKAYCRYDLSSVMTFDTDFMTTVSPIAWKEIAKYAKQKIMPVIVEREPGQFAVNLTGTIFEQLETPDWIKAWPEEMATSRRSIWLDHETLAIMSEAAAHDATKPAFNHVVLIPVDKRMALCSSDSRRLDIAYSGYAVIDETIKYTTFIPLPVAKASGDIESFRLFLNGNVEHFAFRYDNVHMLYHFDGQFPNIGQVIPKDKGFAATIKKEGMDVLRKCIKLGKSPSYKVIFNPDGSLNAGFGTVPTDTILSPELNAFALNAEYLLHAAEFAFRCDEFVPLNVTGPMHPITVESSSGDRLAIVMPIQIKEN